MLKQSYLITFSLMILAILTGRSSPASAFSPGMVDDGLLNLDLKVFIAAKPFSLVLVEKDYQRLKVLRHDGRLQIKAEYRVATGENFGPKKKEGDEKTPEGVYFITKKYIDSKLTVFGTKAFHLNYPNVFDTIAGRDGNGIYIHGTNRKLRYNSTNGCVTLNDHDLARLAESLKVGTMPIIIVPSLLALKTSPAPLPDLTSNNFALAKKLLMPEGINPKLKFRTLYLLRVNGQTVVAGEYGERGQRATFAASYIDFYPKKGWAVLERVPQFLPEKIFIAQGSAGPMQEQAVAQPAEAAAQELPGSYNINLWSWPSHQKDIYLSWYRESLRHKAEPQRRVTVKHKPSLQVVPASASALTRILALACLILGVVLIFMGIRLRKLKMASTRIMDANGNKTIIDATVFLAQTKTLQDEIKLLKNNLQSLQSYLEEARRMDNQDFKARIHDLESSLHAKQAEIEQLITEKSALKLRGMAHLSGQVQELSLMRQELQASQAKLDKSRQDLERLPLLEEMLAAEQDKFRQLAAENAALKQGEADQSTALQDEIENLREQLGAMKEKFRASEEERLTLQEGFADKMALTEREEEINSLVAKLDQDLALSREECNSLKSEIEILKNTEEQGNLKDELVKLQTELNAYQHAAAEERDKNDLLSERLADLGTIEKELKSELSAARERNMEMSEQIERLTANQEELDMARQEIASLSAHNKRLNELEDLLLTRQVEVTRLTNEMDEFRARTSEQHNEELSALQNRIEELQENLLAEKTERRQQPEPLFEAKEPEERLITPESSSPTLAPATPETEPVSEPEKKHHEAYKASDEESLSKGSPYLPNDVLKKWIGQG